MVSPAKISSWLDNPHSIPETDSKELKGLREQYPYCLPLQYLAALQSSADPVSFNTLRQIFPANIVLLHALIHKKETPDDVDHQNNPESIVYPTAESLDYFRGQGIKVDTELPEIDQNGKKHFVKEEEEDIHDKEQSLMVVMSFSEWLAYLQERTRKAKEEEEGKKALRAMWQKQKLAEALEEESDEIPENVFTMAVNSITPEDELISESLAEVYRKQGKKNKAIELYEKLSLRNPEKKIYFAHKIEHLKKDSEI